MKKTKTFSATSAVWIPILILNCLLYVCGLAEDDEDRAYESDDGYYYPKTQNIVFYDTDEITLEMPDNVADPSFAWRATGLRYFVITIFKSKIDLMDNQIANTEDAVWTWNTGLGRGREGNVAMVRDQNRLDA